MRAIHPYHWRLLLLAALLSRAGMAQQARLHGELGLGHALGGHQQREFGWGSTLRVGGELVVAPEFGLVLQGSGTWLTSGEAPTNAALKPLDTGFGFSMAAGLDLRPFARRAYQGAMSPAGIWIGAHGGFTWTGGKARPMVDGSTGYDFLFKQGRLGLGPMLGWEHIFQPNDQLRPDDANLLFIGVHGMFGPAAAKPAGDGDADGDGIADSRDQCRTVPEDKDNFEDEDGCPDVDNDQDTILDRVDKCPMLPEDHDKFEDEDGCPEADNDRDGILDGQDKCPNVAEDKDDFEDDDGCPELDNDHDGIPDREDLCPNEPETKNGYADDDGCPDTELVRVVGDKILLDDRVHFMINSRIIRSISFPLLERVAGLINEHPEYIHIEVQGHTDERGPDSFNERLGQTRAESVMEFLAAHGVAADRLSAKGYGKSKPFVDKRNEFAYYMNRRVEFEITREVKQRSAAVMAPTVATEGAGAKPASEFGSNLFHDKPPEAAKAPNRKPIAPQPPATAGKGPSASGAMP